MSKLHQLVAVLNDLAGQARKILEETNQVFGQKTEHFIGMIKKTEAYDEARKQGIDGIEEKKLVTTVPARFDYTFEKLSAELDAIFQIDLTNQQAKADLVVDDIVIATNVPAVTLLAIENKAKQWLDMVLKAPTLDSGIEWIPDTNEGEFIFRTARPEVTRKTEKVLTPVVLAPATDKHPAQVKESTKDEPIANITTTKLSGCMSSALKAEMANRIQKLILGAKQSRCKANEQETVIGKIADKIFGYIRVW